MLSRCQQTQAGSKRWKIRLDTGLAPDLTVALRMDGKNEAVLDYYLLPLPMLDTNRIRLAEENGLMLDGFRFETLEHFFAMAERALISGARFMTDRDDRITITLIPVDRIRVLNPRERDGKRFQEIVDSIRNVGLKQPIKVTRLNGSGGEAEYGLVYGQGRLEAFIALGQKEIPAIVADLSEEDSLLMSLVENVARRHRRPNELLREIGALSERGYTDRQIARKIGFSKTYVHDIRRLLKGGEERLLTAVETGKMPLNVAVDIAAADDEHVQKVLAEAYESGALSGRQLIEAKRQVERRLTFGKAHLSIQAKRGRSRTSSTELIRALRSQAQQKRLTIKRAEITASRLRLVVQGLHVLLADEHFVTLLRAENVHTMPAPVAHLIEELREE